MLACHVGSETEMAWDKSGGMEQPRGVSIGGGMATRADILDGIVLSIAPGDVWILHRWPIMYGLGVRRHRNSYSYLSSVTRMQPDCNAIDPKPPHE